MNQLIPGERIESKILFIREQKVMLDRDLAELYGVSTKVLLQAVKRNIERFPQDFMFQITKEEFKILRSQIVTSSWGGRRYLPYAFTEHGILMLSSVLNSKRAILINIQIMRAFTRLRKILATHEDLRRKVEELEKKFEDRGEKYDYQFEVVFDAIKGLLEPPVKKTKPIGFLRENDE
ncbi:MAG: ORF6N domain-containing protein [bacterium]|nr:ORF6N domain-containing protein [bacterium]